MNYPPEIDTAIVEHCRIIRSSCEELIRDLQKAIRKIDQGKLAAIAGRGVVQGMGSRIDLECYALSVRMADLELLKRKVQ